MARPEGKESKEKELIVIDDIEDLAMEEDDLIYQGKVLDDMELLSAVKKLGATRKLSDRLGLVLEKLPNGKKKDLYVMETLFLKLIQVLP